MENETKSLSDIERYQLLIDASTVPNGIEEVSYLSSIDFVDIDLSRDNPRITTSIDGGPSITIENEELDKIVEELAGNIILRDENVTRQDLWQHQKVLKGTRLTTL